MTELERELLPCPFCGAGETIIEPQSYWTGMSSQILSVTVKHWCMRTEGQLQSMILVKRKTEEQAVSAWNTRAEAKAKEPQWHKKAAQEYDAVLKLEQDVRQMLRAQSGTAVGDAIKHVRLETGLSLVDAHRYVQKVQASACHIVGGEG